MKVFKYFFLVALFALFLNNKLTSGGSKQDRQLSNNIITTRAPLINRVRERLTSILMQNYEHLAYHHQQYHQHHQNHWNVLHGHYQTSPMTPVSTAIEMSLNSTTTIPETSSISIMTSSAEITESSTISSTTTLSPQKNSQAVTVPFFITTSKVDEATTMQTITISTEALTTQSIEVTSQSDTTTSKIESTTSKTNPTTSKIDPTTPQIESTTSKVESTTPQIESTTTTPIKDPCDDRKILYANGDALIKLCYINESLTWFEAQQKCLSLKYRLFEINTYFKEISMFNYFKVFAVNNEFHWVNGIAEYTERTTEWFVVDPHRVWNYTSNNWYGLVKAPVPGLCLGIIFVSGTGKFTEKDCDVFHSTFWCEY